MAYSKTKPGKSRFNPKPAPKSKRQYNKKEELVRKLRATDYGHTFGPKTGRRRSSVTRGPLKSVERVKDERKPKKRSFIPQAIGGHGLFKMFRRKK